MYGKKIVEKKRLILRLKIILKEKKNFCTAVHKIQRKLIEVRRCIIVIKLKIRALYLI